MKKYVLILAVAVLAGYLGTVAAHAVTVTMESPQTYPGWNIVSVPAIPRNWDPAITDVHGIRGAFCNFPVTEQSILYRWDSPTESWKWYDQWSPQNFRGVLLGDGYYLNCTTPATIVLDDPITENYTTDMWLSLPCVPDDGKDGGWTIIGCPYNSEYGWVNVKVTDGTATLTMEEACTRTEPWLDAWHWWLDAETGSLRSLGYDEFAASNVLQPWRGYWIHSLKDNLALILEVPS